jgi:hypothetical protein
MGRPYFTDVQGHLQRTIKACFTTIEARDRSAARLAPAA